MKAASKFFRAARLDRTVFEEVRWDDEVTSETIIGIAIISLVQYIGFIVLQGAPIGLSIIRGLLESILRGAILWLIASLALWLVATYAFGTRRSGQEIVRVVGVGYLPYVLLAAIPLFAFAPIVAGVWFVAILTVAVQVLYGFPMGKAFATAVLAVAVWVVFILLLLG